MASSISILSLFVLVLISGYFTFPLDNFSSESSPLSFEHEFTTERSFNERATVGDDFFTTPSVTEPFSLEYTTITADIKRSVDDRSDVFATTVEYEFTTDAERRERVVEDFSTVESSTSINITEETPKEKREMEPSSDIVEEETTERVEVVENSKRGLEPVPSATATGKELKEAEPLSEFTTFATTLFTSTSSDVAPEFYTHTSTEFSPIELTTQKYVGSLHKDDEDEGDRKPKPHEKEDEERKSEKEQKRKPKKEEHKPEEEEERKPEKQDDEEQQHETSVDSDKTKDSKKKISKSDKKDSSESAENSSKEKYVTGQLLDQDSSKSFQQRPKGFAILVEPDVFLTSVTNELAEKQRFTTESTKLAQGEESTQAE